MCGERRLMCVYRHLMKTHRMLVGEDAAEQIARAARIIEAGGLVAFPTETVYGLGAKGLDPRALEKVFAAKERPREDPLILHLADQSWLRIVASEVPRGVLRLVERFWPGPLTVILPKARGVPDLATAGLPSVAVRMPAHPVALALIAATGCPLAAPSANRFGRTSPTTADHVLADLDGRINAVLDAGPTRVGVESTVVDARDEARPVILRPGGITRDLVESALQKPVSIGYQEAAKRDEPVVSPGLLERHYSPRARLLVFRDAGPVPPTSMMEAIREAARSADLRPIGVLAFDEDMPSLDGLPLNVEVLGSRSNPPEVARNLFACLRQLDDRGAKIIFARLAPSEGLGESINDRLTRAAGGRLEP